MSFAATVLKVMIASPSDVAAERKLIREVIHEWNVVNSEDRKVVLLPVGWETHSSPEMGDRPQAILNRQVLQGCDILIAAFWTRIGTPTGLAQSGTVEEIEEHIATNKPALLYFSSVPVREGSGDATQFSALKEFKNSCRERGLIEEYDDLSTLHAKLTRQLALTVIRHLGQSIDEFGTAFNLDSAILSPESTQLLLTAADSADGTVMQFNMIEGLAISANSQEFVEPNDPRSEARWRAAVRELIEAGYLEDRSGNGEIFHVTQPGYDAALTMERHSPAT